MSEPKTQRWAALRNRNFVMFLTGRLLLYSAWEMMAVTTQQRVVDLTNNALSVGYIGLALFLPAFGFALFTGPMADRLNRRRIVLVCVAIELLCCAGLLGLVAAGVTALWPLYMILVIMGTAQAFAGPANQAIMPNLVPREQFAEAVSWSSSVMSIARIAGPALGGLVYWLGGPTIGYGLIVLAMLMNIAIVLRLVVPAQEKPATVEKPWREVTAGLRFIWSRKVLFAAISLDMVAVLLGGAVALLPFFAKDILLVGPWGLGVLRAAPAVGAVVMAVGIAHMRPLRKAGPAMLWSVAGFGLATVLFALSTNMIFAVFFLFLVGTLDLISMVVRHTVIHATTPDHMRGRVSAVNLLFIGASNELGEFESGLTAYYLGLVRATVLGGMATILVVGTWALSFPVLRQVGRLDQIRESTDDVKPEDPMKDPELQEEEERRTGL